MTLNKLPSNRIRSGQVEDLARFVDEEADLRLVLNVRPQMPTALVLHIDRTVHPNEEHRQAVRRAINADGRQPATQSRGPAMLRCAPGPWPGRRLNSFGPLMAGQSV